ncbi:hypothetical protein EDF60_2682 [Leucobacter luti]|uniref:hypothetical protein n=1 Tax=Leucobacter luti TaxID=340320 RepID=UPI00104BB15F|nr:hypothetical protein [Leucobacter luti]MCW2289716.1 hypothetical protein [Leucobacter luti]TCK37886.1 hypothetical protein EDF60_2682 [Leucobacter luti]
MTPTHDNTNATPSTGTQQTSERTLGYWLTMTDALVSREYARRFDAEGATRRDLGILSAISGTTEIPGRLREQLERGGKRVCALADRGWIERDETGWQLTDSGEEARTRLAGIVQETTDRIAGSVSPEELATTTATLAAIAREFGWTEATRLPRRGPVGHRGHGEYRGQRDQRDQLQHRGHVRHCGHFGPEEPRGSGYGRGYDRGFRQGPQSQDQYGHPGQDPRQASRGPRGHQGHQGFSGHRRGAARMAAFERGFAAGFTAAQSSAEPR